MMLNRVVLIGRLTRDPELRYTASGIAVAQFTIAIDRTYSNTQGEKETDFIPIVVWRQQAELCANYLRKGRLAAVEGRMQVRNYENNEGRKVYITEVVADNVRFLESNRERDTTAGESEAIASNKERVSSPPPSRSYGDPFVGEGKPVHLTEDDLPF